MSFWKAIAKPLPNLNGEHLATHDLPRPMKARTVLVPCLPSELWIEIGSHCTVIERTMLALTSKFVYQSMELAFPLIKEVDPGYEEFLSLLDRDLPLQRLCARCRKFKPWCKTKCHYENLNLQPGHCINWATFQGTMRSLHEGSLRQVKLATQPVESWCTNDGWSHRLEARAIEGRLILRLESERLFEERNIEDRLILGTVLHNLPSCHCQEGPEIMQVQIGNKIKCAIEHGELASSDTKRLTPSSWSLSMELCLCCNQRLKCPGCHSEYLVRARWIDASKTQSLVKLMK